MPAILDGTGLTIPSQSEILGWFLNGIPANPTVPGMIAIYGAGINVGPNSPDGQALNIQALAVEDQYQFLNSIFSSFDPSQAIGTQLDARVAINGIVRLAGSYTTVNVLVTVTQALTLAGLDVGGSLLFVVADVAGNQYQLVTTQVFGGAGSATLVFQAAKIGAVQVVANTITTIVTVQLGVLSVNNPSGALQTGVSEETDAQLRIRRSRSTAQPNQGFMDGLYAGLYNVAGVTSVFNQENITSGTVSGCPAYGIRCCVAGGASADIANVIYIRRCPGVPMGGGTNAVTVNITQLDGNNCPITYITPTPELLYVSISVDALTGYPTPDLAFIRQSIVDNITYRINQQADISTIIQYVKNLVPGVYVTVASATQGLSLNGSTGWAAIQTPTTPDVTVSQFYLTLASVLVAS